VAGYLVAGYLVERQVVAARYRVVAVHRRRDGAGWTHHPVIPGAGDRRPPVGAAGWAHPATPEAAVRRRPALTWGKPSRT